MLKSIIPTLSRWWQAILADLKDPRYKGATFPLDDEEWEELYKKKAEDEAAWELVEEAKRLAGHVDPPRKWWQK